MRRRASAAGRGAAGDRHDDDADPGHVEARDHAARFARGGRRHLAWFSRVTGVVFFAGFAGIASGSHGPTTLAFVAAVLLAWLKLLALDGALTKAEPKTLRYRILHAPARLVRGGRRRRLKVPRTWPWATQIADAWQRITALPQAP